MVYWRNINIGNRCQTYRILEYIKLCMAVLGFELFVLGIVTSCDREHGTFAKNHGKSLASLAKILPRSYHDSARSAKRTMF